MKTALAAIAIALLASAPVMAKISERMNVKITGSEQEFVEVQ
jgi:hypothetical protein